MIWQCFHSGRDKSFYILCQGSPSVCLMIQFHCKSFIMTEEILDEKNQFLVQCWYKPVKTLYFPWWMSKFKTLKTCNSMVCCSQIHAHHLTSKCLTKIINAINLHSFMQTHFNIADVIILRYIKEAFDEMSIDFFGRNR